MPKTLVSTHESLGCQKSAIDAEFAMLKDTQWGLDELHTGGQLDDSAVTALFEMRV